MKALAPNLKGWNEVPVASLLRRAVGAPVFVDNDVNLAILGERWKGVARGHDTCAFITVGTGIGAGIIVKGELHHGHHFQAGEIALMCMGPQFVDSDFGARGCLETLVGLKALEARWARHASSEGEPGAKGLIEAAQAGDRKARSILDETVTLIGIAAANLTLTLDPSLDRSRRRPDRAGASHHRRGPTDRRADRADAERHHAVDARRIGAALGQCAPGSQRGAAAGAGTTQERTLTARRRTGNVYTEWPAEPLTPRRRCS